MLNWSITFLVMAVLTAILGFGGLVITLAALMKILSIVFFTLFAACLFHNMFRGHLNRQ